MRINNNLMAYNAQNKLNINNNNVADSVRKLSSGLRISRAGDDAAGLAISEKMRAQIQGLDMASKNSQDGISLIQTAEGALNETHSILQRMRELSVQSASDTNVTEDRAALDKELQALVAEIDDIASKTDFNGQNLLGGGFGSEAVLDAAASGLDIGLLGVEDIQLEGFGAGNTVVEISDNSGVMEATIGTETVGITGGTALGGEQSFTFEFSGGRSITIDTSESYVAGALNVGASALDFDVTTPIGKIQTGSNANDLTQISIGDMSASGLSVDSIDITDQTNATAAITAIDAAITSVSDERAGLGAMQNRLEHKILNLDTSSENLQAAESRIRDLDMAAEMTEFTSSNILSQAATSMLAQANSLPQNVLSLLG